MPEDLIGKELLGQFRIIERIGRGGMGEVFKAEQPAMDRLVAIKILHSKLASRPDLVSRFRREARAMSRLSHPNTARVFLYGHLEESQQLYIVMEYLDGVDLARYVRKHGPMELPRALKVMIQVLGALEEAHSVGIVHRDLKPENILLSHQGGMPDFPKVLDFGLAKVHETKPRPGSMILTQEGMVFGTPEFMSPEQAQGEILDSRSDIYSASLIFFELVTGKLPFPRGKPMEYISHHIYTKPTPITERVPELNLPAALDPIVLQALEKDRDGRYQSAREFAEALKTVIPASTNSISARALPEISTQRGESTIKTQIEDPSLHPDQPTHIPEGKPIGKGILIGLIAVIAILSLLVAWLLVTRQSSEDALTPVSTQKAPAAPAALEKNPLTSSPQPVGDKMPVR